MAVSADRDTLHALVDAIPQGRLAGALEAIRVLADPVLVALLTAPAEDEELPHAEVAELGTAEAERAAGTLATVTDQDLARRIGG